MDDNFQSLISYSREHGRVCPQARHWQTLWEMLPLRRQIDGDWKPPPPLILAAWHYASNDEKIGRFAEHLEWAERHGGIAAVAAFLRNLNETDWHHIND
jgi:hypothetical protein